MLPLQADWVWMSQSPQIGSRFLTRRRVEDHARRVDAIEPAGKDTTNDVNTLLGAQNSDGG